MSFLEICQSSLIVTYLIRICQSFFHWRGAIPLSFDYLWQKMDFHKVSRHACILTATTSNFTENYPLRKKTFWPTSNLKIEAVTIFFIWVLKYCIQENYVWYNFFCLSGLKGFFSQNTPSILASFGLKMAIRSQFFG